VALVRRALEDPGLRGALNVVAPGCVRNAELTRTLAALVGRRAILPAPAFAVKAALGPLAGELLGSRRVLPRRAEALGHAFAHPALEGALQEELR
jgi:NAD dependent epimerase/dehydratase family enzyme